MDKKQLEHSKEFNTKLLGQLKASSISIINPADKSNFSKTKVGKINDILAQRHGQRKWLFWFSIAFVTVTSLIVFGLIIVQAYINYSNPETSVKLVSDQTLQIIVTGIFVQFVGLVGIITKSIWNDKPYLDAGVMK